MNKAEIVSWMVTLGTGWVKWVDVMTVLHEVNDVNQFGPWPAASSDNEVIFTPAMYARITKAFDMGWIIESCRDERPPLYRLRRLPCLKRITKLIKCNNHLTKSTK